MRPTAKQLSLRDPAAAALFGVLPGADFGDDYGDDYGDETAGDFGDEVADEVAAEFGDEVGALIRARLRGRAHGRAMVRAPAAPVAAAAWNPGSTQNRALLLDPNAHSRVKVEQYELPLSQAIVIGTPLGLMPNLTATPDTVIKPKRLVCNAPCPNFVFISDIKASNVSGSIASGVTDAYNYNAQSVGTNVHLPKLTPSTRVSITAAYSGMVPANMLSGTASYFTATFYGPSTLAGG